MRHFACLFRCLLCGLICVVLLSINPAISNPGQPVSGPGGAEYREGEIVKRVTGTFESQSYAFYLNNSAPQPRPVIVFLHGWGAVNPYIYGGWINHLVRRGALVLVPRYQEANRTRGIEATQNAADSIKAALTSLNEEASVKPDLEKVVFVGHLAGSIVAINLASLNDAALPQPKLVMAVMPGGMASDPKSRGIPLLKPDQFPEESLLVLLVGDREHLPSVKISKHLLSETSSLPANRKLYLHLLSDNHGFPAISANLAAPASPMDEFDGDKITKLPESEKSKTRQRRAPLPPDALLTGEQYQLLAQLANGRTDLIDYLGFWKTLDLAMDTAFSGQDALALRNNPALSDMGRWPDGWPIKRINADLFKK